MKQITVSYTILATLEVPDNADDIDMNDAIEAYAENEGFRHLIDDCEADVYEDGRAKPVHVNFHLYR